MIDINKKLVLSDVSSAPVIFLVLFQKFLVDQWQCRKWDLKSLTKCNLTLGIMPSPALPFIIISYFLIVDTIFHSSVHFITFIPEFCTFCCNIQVPPPLIFMVQFDSLPTSENAGKMNDNKV